MRRVFALVGLASALVACSNFKDDTVADGGTPESAVNEGGVSDTGAARDATSPPGDTGAADSPVPEASTTDAPAQDGGAPDGPTSCVGEAGCSGEVLVDGLRQATVILVDSSNIYFADPGVTGGAVYQCPKTGCTTPTPLGTGYATGLGLDGVNVYWNDFGNAAILSCTIGGCGGAPKTVTSTTTSITGLTCDGTNLYWATKGDVLTCVLPGCSPQQTLATLQGTVTLAAATGVAYWTSTNAGGSVESCPAAGCSEQPKEVVSAFAETLAVSTGVVYFTVGNAVDSCQASGCGTPHTIGSSLAPSGVATDGVDVYWLDTQSNALYQCPALGCSGGPSELATDQTFAQGAAIALDADYVYWTANTQVLRKHR